MNDILASGPLAEALTEQTLSDTFGLDIALTREDGRYSARARS